MKSVLFVCLGNICRSPMAHGIFRDKALKAGLAIHIESAGTSAYHVGEPSDPRSISTLAAKGIDILNLRSRLFIENDFNDYDYIIAMDTSNLGNIQDMALELAQENLPSLMMNQVYPGENISVPDPYYGGATGFEEVYKMLDLALDELIKKFV